MQLVQFRLGDQYVEPVEPPMHECDDCRRAYFVNYKVARKAQLDAMPRCELCKRRGVLRVGSFEPKVLMCKAHFEKAQSTLRRSRGGLALFFPEASGRWCSQDEIRDMARGVDHGVA